MNIAYLLIGGNIGDRLQYLQSATSSIKKLCGIVAASSPIYETEPWGKEDQNKFLNQSLELHTFLPAFELLDSLLATEEQLGRHRGVKYGERIIDIDILLFNDEVIDTRNLKLPHPELANRRFALMPLNDIASKKIHPVFNKSIAQLLQECPDHLKVEKLP